MTFDPMTKMYISIAAMALMFLTNFLVLSARKLPNGWVSFLLKAAAFLLLIATFVMIIIVVFL